MVLAKVRRPSSTPRRMTSRLPLEQHEIGGLAGDVDRGLDRQAGVGGVHGRRVVDAVAEEPDDVAGPLQRQDDAFLLSRIDFREYVGLLDGVPQRAVVQRR